MRLTTNAGRDDDRFEARVSVPTGAYDWQRPSIHVVNYDRTFGGFLNAEEARSLIDALTAQLSALDAADEEWKRRRAMAEAANDGFLDNADPDMDAAGADDYLADVAP
jgi:hypothetical protein